MIWQLNILCWLLLLVLFLGFPGTRFSVMMKFCISSGYFLFPLFVLSPIHHSLMWNELLPKHELLLLLPSSHFKALAQSSSPAFPQLHFLLSSSRSLSCWVISWSWDDLCVRYSIWFLLISFWSRHLRKYRSRCPQHSRDFRPHFVNSRPYFVDFSIQTYQILPSINLSVALSSEHMNILQTLDIGEQKKSNLWPC